MTYDHAMPLERAPMLQQGLLGGGDLRGRFAADADTQHRLGVNGSHIQLGDPGTCCREGSTLTLLLDESPSVCGIGGNDPTSRRHDEAAQAIAHVANACRCKRERVALASFDHPSWDTVAPQPLSPVGLRKLNTGLHMAAMRSGGSSSLGPALSWAERVGATTPERAAVVVFSDFLLTDTEADQVLRRLAAFPGYVHAVVLGAMPPSILIEDDHVDISVITPTSAPGDVARALFEGLTRFRTGVSR